MERMPARLLKDEGGAAPLALEYEPLGEALIHGLPSGQVSYHLPASTVLAALLFDHSPARLFRIWRVCLIGMALALIYAVCARLGAPWAGMPANIGLALVPGVLFIMTAYIHLFISLWALLIVGLMIAWERKPSLRRGAAVAAALGTSMFFRSVFSFLPPFIALWAWRNPRLAARRRVSSMLVFAGAPYLFLLPWVRMNWLIHKEFVLFERGESIQLIILSALGFVGTDHAGPVLAERIWKETVDTSIHSMNMGPVLAWAARECLAHPLRFAIACAERGWLIASEHPVIFLLALVALVARHRDRSFQALGLVAAYFLGIHCFLPYYIEYYSALWVLLLTGASAAATRALLPETTDRRAASASGACLAGVLALAMALYAYSTVKVLTYPRFARSDPGQALAGALAEHPDEAWLLAESGLMALEERRLPAAIEGLTKALWLRPNSPSWRIKLALAQALAGDWEALLESDWAPVSYASELEVCVFKAYAYWKSGRPEEARRQLRLGMAKSEEGFVLNIDDGQDRRPLLLQRQRILWRDMAHLAVGLVKTQPPRGRDAFLAEFIRVGEAHGLSDARAFIDEESSRANGRGAAGDAISVRGEPPKGALPALSSRERIHEAALQFQFAGDCPRALKLLDILCRRYPREAVYFSDRAVCLYGIKAADRAAADLERAISLDPRLLPAYISLGAIHAHADRYDKALRVYDEGLRANPRGEATLISSLEQARANLLVRMKTPRSW